MATATLSTPTAPFAITPITFEETKEALEQLVSESSSLTVAGVNDKEGLAAVRKARIDLKNYRTSIEKRRKALKAESLEYGRQVDGTAKALTAIIEPEEKRLEHEEGIVEREKARLAQEAEDRRKATLERRLGQLRDCMTPDGNSYIARGYDPVALAGMTDEAFHELLRAEQDAKDKYDRDEAARKAEQDRIAAEQRAESERLAKEKAELDRQRAEQEKAAAEQRRIEQEKLDKERAELDRIKREQTEAQAKIDAEAKRLADEKAAHERQAAIDKAKAEAAEQARKDEIARQEREAAAAKAKAEAEAAEAKRIEAMKPDVDKLRAVADELDAITWADVSEDAQPYSQRVHMELQHAAREIRALCQDMAEGRKLEPIAAAAASLTK